MHCEECGYDYDALTRDALAPTIRQAPARYAEALSGPDEQLREHPFDGVWSTLEYGCHMRDVFLVQRERIHLALREEQPTYLSMRRDERVTEERYNEQDSAKVVRELTDAAHAFADTLDALDDDGWCRTGIYSYPERAVRTLEWNARHTIHEAEHHLMDIRRLLDAVS